MAQSFVTTQGTLIIPGAYPSISVLTQPSGLSTSGVVMLVGEADQGPDYTLETDLSLNAFGPDQAGAVLAKYKSGPLVDAYLAGAAPANDPEITQSPALFILAKTNVSAKGSANMPKWGGGNYPVALGDKGYGKLGNLTSFTITQNIVEQVPVATFAFAPNGNSISLDIRINGGAAQAFNALGTGQLPSQFVTALAGLTGATASGGTDRTLITVVAGTLALAVTGNNGVFTISTSWNVTPTVGDTLYLTNTSVIKGGSNQNAGAWIVTAATSTTVNATKVADYTGGSLNTVTAPIAVSAVAVSSTTDLRAFAPVTITMTAANPIDGVGKSIEIASTLNGGALDNFARLAWTVSNGAATYSPLVSMTASAWVPLTAYTQGQHALNGTLVYRCKTAGTSGALSTGGPVGTAYNTDYTDGTAVWQLLGSPLSVVTSATEYQPLLTISRAADNVNEQIAAGGEIALRIGYKGTTATLTITSTTLTTAVVGGAGANLNLTLSNFATINDLAAYINVQTGYSCAAGSALVGQFSSLAIDEVVAANIGSSNGALVGRIKKDAAQFYTKVSQLSNTVQLGTGTTATVPGLGVPAPTTSPVFLSGGAKGGTTNAQIVGAIDALQRVRGNFLVPLFSRDALADIADPLGPFTEATSTYTIDSINAYAKSHVILMSTLKRRRNRQAFLSKKDTFLAAQVASSNIANYRCSFYFQDVKTVNSVGNLVQSQPWMAATLAACMQAAGFYKLIVNKGINCSAALQAGATPADFSDQDMTMVENALLAGLNPIEQAETGGYRWVSDQTTYGVDNNFVFNSIQAVYVADVIALTCAKRMQDKFKGKNIADISAAMAVSFMQGIMSDFLRLKLIAPSDDGAPGGFKNLKVQISGSALIVSCEVKLATGIYFIPISFLVSAVQQAATK
jgi:hypothetical protein